MYLVPALLFMLSWEFQLVATDLVGMHVKGGFFILFLSSGVIFVSTLIYGFRAVAGILLGAGVYFYLFKDQNVQESVYQAVIQNTVLALNAFFAIWIVKRWCQINESLDRIGSIQTLQMIGLSQIANSAYVLSTETYQGDLLIPLPVIFLVQFLGSMIGCLLVFFIFIYAFWLLAKIKLNQNCNEPPKAA